MSTEALYSSCIDETLRLYSASAVASSSGFEEKATTNLLLLPFANITYKYVFDYRGKNSMLSLILNGGGLNRPTIINRNFIFPINFNPEFNHAINNAVCHGDELFYLFNLKFASRKPDDNRDLIIQRRMLLLWTDFAKHG